MYTPKKEVNMYDDFIKLVDIISQCYLACTEDWKTLNSSSYNLKRILVRDIDFNKVQFTRDCTGERSDGRHTSRQIFHVMFKLSLAAAAVAIIKSTTRRLSSKDTLSHVSRQPEI